MQRLAYRPEQPSLAWLGDCCDLKGASMTGGTKMKSKSFVVSGVKLRAVRQALYEAIGPSLDALDQAQANGDRCATLAALLRLFALAEMLDKVGWCDHCAKPTLTVSTAEQAALLMEVIGDEIDREEERAAAAEDPSEGRPARRIGLLIEALSAVAVGRVANGLIDKDAAGDD
jgi:hypothetical protein